MGILDLSDPEEKEFNGTVIFKVRSSSRSIVTVLLSAATITATVKATETTNDGSDNNGNDDDGDDNNISNNFYDLSVN